MSARTQAQLSMSILTQALQQSMPNQWTQSYQLSMSTRTQAQLSMSKRTEALNESMPNQLNTILSAINVNTDTISAINVKTDTSSYAKPMYTISPRMFQQGSAINVNRDTSSYAKPIGTIS